MYTADYLLKGNPDVRVDIFERLPVPFGLVRYGVAPDHQSVKNVTDRFHEIMSHPRCSLLANVRVGTPGPPPEQVRRTNCTDLVCAFTFLSLTSIFNICVTWLHCVDVFLSETR